MKEADNKARGEVASDEALQGASGEAETGDAFAARGKEAETAAPFAAPPSPGEPPAPPAAPCVKRDYRDLSQEVARIRAQEAERMRRAKKNRAAALAIAVVGVLVILVGAAGAFLAAHIPEAGNAGDDTAVSQPADEGGSDASAAGDAAQAGEGSSDSGGVSAVEAVVASDQINAAFAALSTNADGEFTEFVQAFMDDYDQGVNAQSSYTLADLGIQADELSQALLSGFSCSVTNVDVQGQTAWVSVDVTSKSLADQADAFARAVESGAGAAEDEESYKAFLKQAYFDAFSGVSPRSHSLLVTVDRADGKWAVTEDTMEYILGSVWYTSA